MELLISLIHLLQEFVMKLYKFFPCVFGFAILEFLLSDKRALIVYPQGCYEVEQLVLFLVKQLGCIGIYPLTDLTQGQRVGEEGESVVMIKDFKRATYIIILCTEETCKYYASCRITKHFEVKFPLAAIWIYLRNSIPSYLSQSIITPIRKSYIPTTTCQNFRNVSKICEAHRECMIWAALIITLNV